MDPEMLTDPPTRTLARRHEAMRFIASAICRAHDDPAGPCETCGADDEAGTGCRDYRTFLVPAAVACAAILHLMGRERAEAGGAAWMS